MRDALSVSKSSGAFCRTRAAEKPDGERPVAPGALMSPIRWYKIGSGAPNRAALAAKPCQYRAGRYVSRSIDRLSAMKLLDCGTSRSSAGGYGRVFWAPARTELATSAAATVDPPYAAGRPNLRMDRRVQELSLNSYQLEPANCCCSDLSAAFI